MSTNRWMDKLVKGQTVYPCSGILPSGNVGQTTNRYNISKSQKRVLTKADSKGYMPNDTIFI